MHMVSWYMEPPTVSCCVVFHKEMMHHNLCTHHARTQLSIAASSAFANHSVMIYESN